MRIESQDYKLYLRLRITISELHLNFVISGITTNMVVVGQ